MAGAVIPAEPNGLMNKPEMPLQRLRVMTAKKPSQKKPMVMPMERARLPNLLSQNQRSRLLTTT
jgi:hypothetical protein